MNKEFTLQLLDGLKSFLKLLGYKKSGNTFCKISGDLMFFIQLQKSIDSSAEKLKFTVNTSILSIKLAEANDAIKPSYLDSHWYKRIGFYLSVPQDKWWEIENSEQVPEILREISDIITHKVLFQFSNYSSTSDLLAEWGKRHLHRYNRWTKKKLSGACRYFVTLNAY